MGLIAISSLMLLGGMYLMIAFAWSEEEAKEYLMRYDLEAYEKHFGELEEA